MAASVRHRFGFKTTEDEEDYDNTMLRRQTGVHVVQQILILKKWLREQLAATYGAPEPEVGPDGRVIPPYSVRSYLKYIVTPGEWLDAIFLTLVCSMFALRATVIRSTSCAPMPFRHANRGLKQVDLVMVFNCSLRRGHYFAVDRRDGDYVEVTEVYESRGYRESVKKEAEERKKSGGDGAGKGDGGKAGGRGGQPKGKGKGDKGKGDADDDDDEELGDERVGELIKSEGVLKKLLKVLKKEKVLKAQKSSSESSIDKPSEPIQKPGVDDRECDHCHRPFPSRAALKRHINKMHRDKYLYRCEKCNKGLMSRDGYLGHQKQHLKAEQRKKCDKCKKTFNDNRGLVKHLAEACAKKVGAKKAKSAYKDCQYKCPYCAKQNNRYATNVKRYYDSHLNRCKGPGNPNKKSLDCDLCNKTGFPDNSTLMRHKKRDHKYQLTQFRK